MHIPNELIGLRQWVCWRMEVGERAKKVPYNPITDRKASSTQQSTWCDFRQAERNIWKYDGLGFVFTENDPYCGIDIDGGFANGRMTPDASRLVASLSSFTEISPSGNGLHVIVKATVGKGTHPAGIGVFDRARYFTMSGRHLAGAPFSIETRQDEVDQLLGILYRSASATASAAVLAYTERSDEDILARMFSAANGERVREVWEGDLTSFDGDWSRADLYLMGRLAFWTNKNRAQMVRLFGQSGLVRKKTWRHHGSKGGYLDRTIAKALAS